MEPVRKPRLRNWKPQRITLAMHQMGVTHESLAQQLVRSRSIVSLVVGGRSKSAYVAGAVAEVIGRKPWEIWPRIYAPPAEGSPSEAPMTEPTPEPAPRALAS
jgi:lambda repressor-like predicted transcriptional regulator